MGRKKKVVPVVQDPMRFGVNEHPTGLFIKQYLIDNGEVHPMAVWRALKEERHGMGWKYPSWKNFLNLWYLMCRLGLIKKIDDRPETDVKSGKPVVHAYYRINDEMEDSPGWRNAYKMAYPNLFK